MNSSKNWVLISFYRDFIVLGLVKFGKINHNFRSKDFLSNYEKQIEFYTVTIDELQNFS